MELRKVLCIQWIFQAEMSQKLESSQKTFIQPSEPSRTSSPEESSPFHYDFGILSLKFFQSSIVNVPHFVNSFKKSLRVFGYKYTNTRHSCQDLFFVMLIKIGSKLTKMFPTDLGRKQFSYKNVRNDPAGLRAEPAESESLQSCFCKQRWCSSCWGQEGSL